MTPKWTDCTRPGPHGEEPRLQPHDLRQRRVQAELVLDLRAHGPPPLWRVRAQPHDSLPAPVSYQHPCEDSCRRESEAARTAADLWRGLSCSLQMVEHLWLPECANGRQPQHGAERLPAAVLPPPALWLPAAAAGASRPGGAAGPGRVDPVAVGVGARPPSEASSGLEVEPALLSSEKDAKLAQKLGQVQPFVAVSPLECMCQLVYSGPV